MNNPKPVRPARQDILAAIAARPSAPLADIAKGLGVSPSWVRTLNRCHSVRPKSQVEAARIRGKALKGPSAWKRSEVSAEFNLGKRPMQVAQWLVSAAKAKGEEYKLKSALTLALRVAKEYGFTPEKIDKLFLQQWQKKGVVLPQELIQKIGWRRAANFLRIWTEKGLSPWEVVRYNCWRLLVENPKGLSESIRRFKKFRGSIADRPEAERVRQIEEYLVRFEKASAARKKPNQPNAQQ